MLPYILKSTFCLVLLLGFYQLVLEKEKMHRFNRFYLIGSILFSCLVPGFIITVEPTIIETSVFTGFSTLEQIPHETIPTQQITETIDYTQYIIGVYILISSILFILLSKKVYSLLNKVKQNQHINYFSATVVLLKERIVPYTFLHYIFINKHSYQTDSLEEQILTHELAHVEQKHSIDVLFIEVLQNLFWFNPIFRYYKKAIQLNHEFLADDAVIQSHKNITEYQYLLLNTTAQNNNIYLASNFNYSLTKKRLLMMTKPSSSTKILLKKLLVLPLVAGFIFAFAQRVEAQEKIETIEEQVFTPIGEKVHTGFKDLNGVKHYFVTIKKSTKFYNKNGKLVNNKGEVISNKKANASDIITGNYITKIYFNGKVFCEFIDNKPNERAKEALENYKKLKLKLEDVNKLSLSISKGISKKEMNEYKELMSKAKNDRIFRYKQLNRMKELYKKMSTEQQNSVVDVFKLAPPFPRLTYKKKTPTKAQFNSWKNKEKFALWIDGKVVDNSVLNKYKRTDFPYYSGSFVHKNARKGKFPQEYQYHLYTQESFKKMKEREAKEKKNTVTIFINKNGDLLVNGEVTTKNKLKDVLDKIDIDKTKAFIKILGGEKSIKKRDIVEIKKILRKNGFYNISWKIPPPPKPQVIEVKKQQKTTFHEKWFITIDGQKYYYTFDKNERVARYYKNGKLVDLNIVKEYSKKHKIFERIKSTGKHYVFKTEREQKIIDQEFSDLGGMYFRMPRVDKNKVSRPNHPSRPYVTLWKNGKKTYKKRSELTTQDRLLMMPPPPPPNASKEELKKFKASMKVWRKRTGQKHQVRGIKPVKIEVIKNKKGLVEVIETPDWKSAKRKLE